MTPEERQKLLVDFIKAVDAYNTGVEDLDAGRISQDDLLALEHARDSLDREVSLMIQNIRRGNALLELGKPPCP